MMLNIEQSKDASCTMKCQLESREDTEGSLVFQAQAYKLESLPSPGDFPHDSLHEVFMADWLALIAAFILLSDKLETPPMHRHYYVLLIQFFLLYAVVLEKKKSHITAHLLARFLHLCKYLTDFGMGIGRFNRLMK